MATSSDDTGAGGGGSKLTPSSAASSSKPRKERTSMCSYCGMTFNKKEHLQRHERTHTLDRPYHCDFPGCGKAFARRDTLTRHTRLHQRDEVQGALKLPLSQHGDDDDLSETFTTPSGSKQVSPATSGSTAPAPQSAALLSVKGKKAAHSRTSSVASQKSSRRGSGSRAPSSLPGSKKNTPEYKTPAEDNQPSVTPTAAIRSNRPRRAAAAALYDENAHALMDEDTPSEPDEMQEDSGNDQDFMVIPAEEKPDVRQVSHPALTVPIGQPVNQGQKGEHQPMHRMDDVIKPLLPSLHTSSYLARTLEAQHQQGIPHVKPTQATPIPATALASGHQPIYNFASWDHTNAINAGQQNQNLGVHGNGSNPALLGYSSSANSSGSSSGSTYNSSQLGSMGSPSLASPYSFTGSNPQATPGSALGLDLGLPPSPPTAGISPAQQVQHFQGFSFPANNSNNPTSASFNNEGSAGSPTQQQPWRIPPYSPGGQQQQSGSNFESFPSFQGSSYGQQQQQQQQQAQQQHQRNTSFAGPPAFPIPTASANTTAASNGNTTVPSNGTSGSQGYTNQSPSTAAQSFLASGTSGPYSPQLSQREPPSSLLNLSTSAPAAVQSAFMNAAAAAAAANAQNSFENRKNGSTASFRKNAPSFAPSFWAHMSVQHQEPPAAAAPPPAVSMPPSSYRHMHHRSSTTSSFSPTDEYEVLSNHSNTSSPISAPSLLSTSPTLTTSMNLYSMTSPASDISNLPSLSSSFSSAFSGDFLNSANGLHNVGSVAAGAGGNGGVDDGNNGPTSAFKHRSSFMEPLMSLDHVNPALRATHTDLNAAMLKAADAHTDQFINWPERDASPFTFPGLSPENAFSAPSVNTSNSPSSTSYLDLGEYDNTQTSLFGDKTFTVPLDIAQNASGKASHGGTAGTGMLHAGTLIGDGINGIGRQSPISSLEDWLLKQTSSNEYVF